MLRHEQQTVRMALATALKHSCAKVHAENGAPRSQTAATRAREVEEHEMNNASRRQKAPPPGVRPGILTEPGPQRSDRSRRHSSGEGLPTLSLPYWLGRRDAASSLQNQFAAESGAEGGDAAVQIRELRRRKQRRKRKLPRTSSFSRSSRWCADTETGTHCAKLCSARRCATTGAGWSRQRGEQFGGAVVDVLVAGNGKFQQCTNQPVVKIVVFPQVQFLDMVLDVPVWCNDRCQDGPDRAENCLEVINVVVTMQHQGSSCP